MNKVSLSVRLFIAKWDMKMVLLGLYEKLRYVVLKETTILQSGSDMLRILRNIIALNSATNFGKRRSHAKKRDK